MAAVAEVSPSRRDGVTTRRISPAKESAVERALAERAAALRLLETGEPATALVVACRDTDASYNGTPVAELTLLLERVQGEPYRVVRYAAVPPRTRPRADAQARVAVLVDPDRPTNVLLRWDLRPLSA